MQPDEYELMSQVEERHWWYRGLRDAVARILRREELALGPGSRVLDAGCGTGENLRSLLTPFAPAYLGGFDLNERALVYARRKAPEADVYASDICDPEIRVDTLDLVVSLDVIYIPGVERCLPGLERLVERLRSGGLLVLNLPAYDWLYSQHDLAIHTRERYTTGRVRALLERLGLQVERLSYRLCLLFPAVALQRLTRMRGARDGRRAPRSDLNDLPRESIQRALVAVLRGENALIARGLRLPWGSSVLAVGRKR